MNKILPLLIAFLPLLISCSNTVKEPVASLADTQQSKPQEEHTAAAQSKKPAAKKHRGHHRPLADGTLSLDITRHGNTLHLLTGTHNSGKKELWHQSSSDNGKTWSTAVSISNGQAINANLSRGNDARLAVQGNNIVVLYPGRKEGAPHNAGPMLAARSDDGGKTWQNSPIPSHWAKGPHNFFAMDGNDSVINAIWLDTRHGRSSVKGSQGMRYSQTKDGGKNWSDDQTLDDITCACCWNTAKFDHNQQFHVLYRDKEPTDMAIGVVNSDHSWQRVSPVGAFKWDFPGCPHIGGGLAFQNKSEIQHAVVGTGHAEHLGVHYLRSSDNGKNWTAPMQLGDESAIHGDIAALNNGRVVAIWDMRTEDGLTIFYAESKDQGANWGKPTRLSDAGMRATHPRIIAHNEGFLSLWTESKTGKVQNLKMKSL